MKKTLVALAALAVTSAFAQSSVTISGVADVGIQYSNTRKENQFVAPATPATPFALATNAGAPFNGNAVNSVAIDRGNNNRIIFSGVEDLGGGLAATFAFQMRFEPKNGNVESNGRPLFQGETTVGLRGGFGALKLGRWLPANQQLNGGTIDPWGVTTVATLPYAAGFATSPGDAGGEGRIGSAIFYSTPSFGGFAGHLTLGSAKGATGKIYQSLAGSYNNGPINAMIGYERNVQGDTLANLGANYDLGVAKIYAGYGRANGGSTADRAGGAFNAVASTAFIGGLNNGTAATTGQGQVAVNGTVTSASIGAKIPLGAATILVGYGRVSGDVVGAVRTDADHKIGLGVNYALSKRTSVYSDIAGVTNRKVLSNGVAGTTGARSTQFDVGIAHSF